MTSWQWIPPTALTGYTAVLATVTYWRQNAHMGWSMNTVLSSNEKLGVRQIEISRIGSPAYDVRLAAGNLEEHRDKVGRGGVISLSPPGSGLPYQPRSVQITWRGRFGRRHIWRS